MTVLAIVGGDREREEVRRIGAILGAEVEFIESDSLGLSRAIASDLLFVGDGVPADRALSLIRRLHRRNPGLLIAAMPGDTDPGSVNLLEAGAAVVIRDNEPPEEAAEAIRAAEAGRAILDPDTAGALVVRIQELSKLCVDEHIDVSRCNALTTREREIIGLMARRATNEQIAERLGIAVGTVKTHVHNILDKLDVDSRALAGVYWRLFSGESRAARIQG
jgi:DNA-binding NarL/FixJ family response regulator